MQAVQELRKHSYPVNYQEDSNILKRFILFFQEGDNYKYLSALRNTGQPINIELADLAEFDETGLVARIEKNAFTYVQLIHKIIDDILFNNEEHAIEETDDVFLYQRISRLKELFPEKKVTDVFPGALLRNYTVNLVPRAGKTAGVREVGAKEIGQMVRIRGIVTRVTQVKPSVRVATYICESCGTEIYQAVENEVFEALEECFSEKCRTRRIRGALCLVTRGSKFTRYQSVQVQELTSDVPHGSIPRLVNVECYSDLTERVKPGECVVMSGVFMPRPYHGMKRVRAGLLNDVYLHCTHIEYTMPVGVGRIQIDPATLISAFAPEIYGMRDIKKILLLMLAGAPVINRDDGMRIRGDINVLLLGDPGIAKSQLLKTAAKISRRGLYTTGKGSSGVGLTASVSKDPVTEEVVLEGGALVLADGGVCCIDELDKMNEFDRVAIHEVMEQQSVSISKAGINTTLNARCAILAAANPVRGRYDPKKTLEHNVGLPVSLLSRFDVICVLKDDASPDNDLELATHVTSLHLDQPVSDVDYSHIRAYLDAARTVNPVLSSTIRDRLVDAYTAARRDSTTTPRYLLSLIRLTLAHARLRMSDLATVEDATEAIHILSAMRVPAAQPKAPISQKREIYNFVLGCAQPSGSETIIDLDLLYAASPYPRSAVDSVIEEFCKSGIWIKRNEKELLVIN